jgi:hemerythrin-like domain-containing protein
MALKRDEALQPLSRQHHQGLLVSLFLSNGLKKGVATKPMRDFILQFWQDDLLKHFEAEEQVLVPFAKPYTIIEPLITRMLLEHQQIVLLINRINNEARAEQLETIKEFADKLEQHIRFEERELFEQMQLSLSAEDMSVLNFAFSAQTEKDFCVRYPDKFWE